MKLAAEKGGKTFNYIEKILKQWAGANLQTLDEVKSYQHQQERNKQVSFAYQSKRKSKNKDILDAFRREAGLPVD